MMPENIHVSVLQHVAGGRGVPAAPIGFCVFFFFLFYVRTHAFDSDLLLD